MLPGPISDQLAPAPEWSARIKQLISRLALTQASLGERLGVSPAMISRWVNGNHEPTAEAYVSLGNLAGLPEAIYFWERAGIDPGYFKDTTLRIARSSLEVNLMDFKILAGRRVSGRIVRDKPGAVLIPLLNLTAFADLPQDRQVPVSEAEVIDLLMAPLNWSPNPDTLVAMKVSGDSMIPIISPDSIIAVDTISTARETLDGKLVVLSHRDHGYKVGRLQRLPSTDILVSANHAYPPIDVKEGSRWKVVGEVLWWVSRDSNRGSERQNG